MVFLLAISATPLFRAADVPPNPRGARISTLDGLRGFLALGVFFDHGAVYHEYILSDQWHAPPRFYSLLGDVGVAMFFMITGYLFWSRLIVSRGRPGWIQLYIGRVFRIGPLYLFAIASMLLIVFMRGGFILNVPPLLLAKSIVRWLSLGFLMPWDVNGYSGTASILAYATWTLQFEWYFYLSLPILAITASSPRLHLPFAAGALVTCLAYAMIHAEDEVATLPICMSLFLAGMIGGSLNQNGIGIKVREPFASIIVCLLISTVFVACRSSFNCGAIILLGGAFYLIASGCTIFGLLTSRAARRLGDVSYGIYLLQGLVLTVVFSFSLVQGIALGSPLGHWGIVLLCATLLIVVATLTHVGIERTGIELGKRSGRVLLGGKLERPAPLS